MQRKNYKIRAVIISGLTGFGLLFFSCHYDNPHVSVCQLKCEYLSNPLGMDNRNPRFTWQIKSEMSGTNQQAYQLFIGCDSIAVSLGTGRQWESGTVYSGRIPAIYGGPVFKAFTRYYWAVRIKDENGCWSPLSEVSWFETGMIDSENWKGDWITDTYDYDLKPAALFRKSIQIGKKIQSARIYIAAGGLYELSVNGKKAGDHVLDPMFTRFDRRNLYVSYDVTTMLTEGENILGVRLGNGWYNHQPNTVWYFNKAPWRARPRFCLDCRIIYEDGTKEIFSTDKSWRTKLSAVISNHIYVGEHFDARLQQQAWDEKGFNDSDWKQVIPTGVPSTRIVSQNLHPIREVEVIPAIEMRKLNDRNFVFNFGRNISGTGRLFLLGEEGTKIKMIHAERIDKKGHADNSLIDQFYLREDDSAPMQTDMIILSGKEDYFQSWFSYKGFQYIEVLADRPVRLNKNNLKAIFIHSDLPSTGSINTSNDLINKIWKASNASYLSNMFGYPTDCPQREKNGWTGDSHIIIETGLYNFDGITVYEKWMADHRDEQQPNGVFPAIIPTSGWGYQWLNGVDWTSTISIIPWNIYLFYGDSRLLEECYENIKRYVEYLNRHYPTGLTDWGLGDWIPVQSRANLELCSSIYYFVDATILAKAAGIFERYEDVKKYTDLAAKIKNSINRKYLNAETGIYGSGYQTEQSMALYWQIVPDSLKKRVAEKLAQNVKNNNCHVDVGLLGSKSIFNALSENGYADLAFEVAVKDTYPSWGWWIKNGATTLNEHWKLNRGSLNHPSFGEINAWFYKGLGGIYPDETDPGFKNIILKPNFVNGLRDFEARHKGPYGEILSSWKRGNDTLSYCINIPPNSTADLYLGINESVILNKDQFIKADLPKVKNEDQIIYELESGTYCFYLKEKL